MEGLIFIVAIIIGIFVLWFIMMCFSMLLSRLDKYGESARVPKLMKWWYIKYASKDKA
jgi:hypothetical protein